MKRTAGTEKSKLNVKRREDEADFRRDEQVEEAGEDNEGCARGTTNKRGLSEGGGLLLSLGQEKAD